MDTTPSGIINPIYDEGFKLIFGRENISEILLIDLLNNVFLGDPIFGNITSLTFINSERPNEIIEGKGVRYDICCRTASGHQYIVEMQKGYQKHFIERCQYYVSRGISEQGYKGADSDCEVWDFSLVPVVGVFFCNFNVNGLEPKPVVKGSLRDDESGQPIGHWQRYAFIQLPCFKKEEAYCESKLEKWIYNIKNMGTTQSVAFTTDSDIFSYLRSVSNVAALSRPEREHYEACLKRARDYNAVLKSAKELAMEEGLAEGRAEGRAVGLAEGRAEGLAEGRAEGRAEANRITALNLLGMNVAPDVVAKATGLSVEEVEALKKTLE
ncbi:MAG: Rpn family recombination-promoting nuclease/putative transposase [Muribaculaceae bacterium]|nr:Rpn family recombination-promoting nuclease/putative transposase [Muribaculaceae bacterium]